MTPSTVLLIDSDQDSMTIYSLILRHHGYEVVPASDGATGLRLALELLPAIVISELFLPFVQDNSLLHGLRNDVRTVDTPVILLDSIPVVGEKLVAREPKTSRLTKPCEPSRLVREVNRLLALTESVI